MPCNSDYMESTTLEKESSKIVALLDELDGMGAPDKGYGDGYDSRVYGKITRHHADLLVSTLCDLLQGVNVSAYSLEMQVWWRDHQAADKARLKRELQAAKDAQARIVAMSKLTMYEIKLLGIKS